MRREKAEAGGRGEPDDSGADGPDMAALGADATTEALVDTQASQAFGLPVPTQAKPDAKANGKPPKPAKSNLPSASLLEVWSMLPIYIYIHIYSYIYLSLYIIAINAARRT